MEFTEKEKDLKEHLFKQPNKAGYIKALIRQDMNKQKDRANALPFLLFSFNFCV